MRKALIILGLFVCAGFFLWAISPAESADAALARFFGPLPPGLVVNEWHKDVMPLNPLHDDSHAWHVHGPEGAIKSILKRLNIKEFPPGPHGDSITDSSGELVWFDPIVLGSRPRYYHHPPFDGPCIEIWVSDDGLEAIVYIWFI